MEITEETITTIDESGHSTINTSQLTDAYEAELHHYKRSKFKME